MIFIEKPLVFQYNKYDHRSLYYYIKNIKWSFIMFPVTEKPSRPSTSLPPPKQQQPQPAKKVVANALPPTRPHTALPLTQPQRAPLQASNESFWGVPSILANGVAFVQSALSQVQMPTLGWNTAEQPNFDSIEGSSFESPEEFDTFPVSEDESY
jgi:hypothetical protein